MDMLPLCNGHSIVVLSLHDQLVVSCKASAPDKVIYMLCTCGSGFQYYGIARHTLPWQPFRKPAMRKSWLFTDSLSGSEKLAMSNNAYIIGGHKEFLILQFKGLGTCIIIGSYSELIVKCVVSIIHQFY